MYYSARQIAQKYGIGRKVVENLCHARGQKFAMRLTPTGKFYIEPKKFEEFLERKGLK